MEPLDEACEAAELELAVEPMPTLARLTPATHGTVRMLMARAGETAQRCDVHVGCLHRGFEKMREGYLL